MGEIENIKRAYNKREQQEKGKLYSKFNLGSLYNGHQIQREVISALKKNGINNLSDTLIFEVGCGKGGVLRDFIQFGANPENLSGIDLLPERIEVAKKLSPNIKFYCGNAENLPMDNNSADLILSYVVFTSILSKEMKEKIAKEMVRILASKGIIIWFDFFLNNPWNPDVRGVRKKEIHQLFPGCTIKLRKICLIPQLMRFISPYSFLACYLLEKIPFLRTHYLGVIQKG